MPPLTPLDIQHKEFTKAMRGYAMHEVDTFLDQVTEEFTRMQDEIARLREQASSAAPAQPAPVMPKPASSIRPTTNRDPRHLCRHMMTRATMNSSTATAAGPRLCMVHSPK